MLILSNITTHINTNTHIRTTVTHKYEKESETVKSRESMILRDSAYPKTYILNSRVCHFSQRIPVDNDEFHIASFDV